MEHDSIKLDSQPQIFETDARVFDYLASELKRYSEMPVSQHISLSGGTTPKALFQFIVQSAYRYLINWKQLHFWWGDERCVPEQSAESNVGEAKRLLFSHVNIPAENLHPIPMDMINAAITDSQPRAYAFALQQFIHDMKQSVPEVNGYPQFDWILLGIGEDGHTASLFPGQFNPSEIAPAILCTKTGTEQFRISLSAMTIVNSLRTTFLALGEAKAPVVQEILMQQGGFKQYPASWVLRHARAAELILNNQAASLLPKEEH